MLLEASAKSILNRTTGYLKSVASHSLNPYSGCAYGKSLCGVGCYARHDALRNKGREWGTYLEIKSNAAELYRRSYVRESTWAKSKMKTFSIFMSSVTDPMPPIEMQRHVTLNLLWAMNDLPPEGLILQTHSHRIAAGTYVEALKSLPCDVRVHISIESDRESLPGLPPAASKVEDRLAACEYLASQGLFVVATVAPLLPIEHPRRFFQQLSKVANAVIIDHFVGGDGTWDGARTKSTPLPAAMEAATPTSTDIYYRSSMTEIALEYFDKVGVGPEGFAGDWYSGARSIQPVS